MPALKPTDFSGRIVWLGFVADRSRSLRSQAVDRVDVTFDGIAGDAHGGAIRSACSRTIAQHPRGAPIRNVRQITILSQEELDEIAEAIGDASIDPAWLGAQIVLSGLPDLTHLPSSSRLQAPSGTSLVVDMENRPCHLPGREIEQEWKGLGSRFKAAAAGRRGVTAWVEREGALAVGDRLVLHVPDQPPWPHLDVARG